MVLYACPGARRTTSNSPTGPSLQVAGLSLSDFFTYKPTEYQSPGPEARIQASREWVRSQLLRMTAIHTPAARGTTSGLSTTSNIAHDAAGVSVDTNTLKWKSWVGQPPDEAEAEIPEPGAPYKLTQAEFRRLNDQVREGSAGTTQTGRLQRGSGFKEDTPWRQTAATSKADMFMTYEGRAVPSLPSRQGVYVIKATSGGTRGPAQCGTYAIPNPFPPQRFVTNEQGQQAPVIHRSQLASSFRAFQEKKWRPYEGGGREGGGEGASSRLSSSRPSSSSSVRSEQRLLDKRSSSAIGHRSPVPGRPPTGSHTPGVTYPHPANRYSHQQNDHSSRQHASHQQATLRGSQPDLSDGTIQNGIRDCATSTYGSQTGSQSNLIKQDSVPNLAPLPASSKNIKPSMTPAATEISSKPDDHLVLAYDTLTPEIIYQLSSGPRPLSVYGSRPQCYRPELTGRITNGFSPQSGANPEEGISRHQTSPASAKRDTDSTSGIGTDKDSDGEEDSDDDGDRDSNDSDDERIPEPKLEDVKMADLPKLILRPEQLDAMYIPDQPHDRRRYDFDPMKCEIIPYEFKSALSPHLMALDLHQASISERHWRAFTKAPAADINEEKIIDRLLELEQLQKKTKEIEMVRRDRLRSAHVRARGRVGVTMRQQSAKLGERKCCSDCLQVACVGDCPGKRNHGKQLLGSSNCLICAEKDCNGRCCESAYDARSRQIRIEEEPKKTLKFRPRSCTSCTTKNPSKISNANNIILGRPKSSYSTYSSANNAHKPPRDMRQKGGGSVTNQLEEEFERLGIEPDPDHQGTAGDRQAPASGGGKRKLKGRASQLPGKSFFSQRRHSLTDIAKEMRVKSANKKRLKNGKKKSSKADSDA